MYTAAVLNASEYHDIYEEIALTGSCDQETRTKAQGLLTILTSSRAIIAFITTKNVLENVRHMVSKLQKRDLDIYQAYSMIDQARERIIMTRQEIEEEYSVWYKEEYSVWYKEEYSVWYKEEYSVWYRVQNFGLKGGCANHCIYIFWFCNMSTQRQLVMSYCSTLYGVCFYDAF